MSGTGDSIYKLEQVRALCIELGVQVDPLRIISNDFTVMCAPLQSWYHAGFDQEPDYEQLVQPRKFSLRWADFRNCRWPESITSRDEFLCLDSNSGKPPRLSEYFASLSEPFVAAYGADDVQQDDTLITLSHFVPDYRLVPEKRFLLEPDIPKVVGSKTLGEQVSRLRPALHVFGHTHIPIDLRLGDTRFLHWPLGSVREQTRQCRIVSESGPLLVFDGSNGGLLSAVSTFWGDHYRENARDPTKTTPAPWVLEYRNRRALRQRS